MTKPKAFLGISITNGKRAHIESGKQYDSLFPKMNGLSEDVIDDIVAEKTAAYMCQMIIETLYQTAKIAKVLKGKTVKETCQNIHTFLMTYIQYELDDGEELREPARLWHDRKGDCDCMTAFAVSTFINCYPELINHVFVRIADYGSDWQHVYAVVDYQNELIVLDGVIHTFNLEKPYKQKMDFPMNATVKRLSGIDEDYVQVSDLGNVSPTADRVLYETLVYELAAAKKDPNAVKISAGYSPKDYIQKLENLVKAYGTPKFDQLLDSYATQDAVHQSVNGLGSIFKGKKAAVKKPTANANRGTKPNQRTVTVKATTSGGTKPKVVVGSKVKSFFSNLSNAAKDLKTQIKTNPKQALQTVVHSIGRVSPLNVAARGVVRLALTLNFLKIASKLQFGYLTQQEAADKGCDAKKWAKCVSAVKKLEDKFFLLGGKKENIKEWVMKGAKRKNGMKGLGDPTGGVATIAAGTAGAAPILAEADNLAKEIEGVNEKMDLVQKIKDFIEKIKGFFKKEKIEDISGGDIDDDTGESEGNTEIPETGGDATDETANTNARFSTEGDQTSGGMSTGTKVGIGLGVFAVIAVGAVMLLNDSESAPEQTMIPTNTLKGGFELDT